MTPKSLFNQMVRPLWNIKSTLVRKFFIQLQINRVLYRDNKNVPTIREKLETYTNDAASRNTTNIRGSGRGCTMNQVNSNLLLSSSGTSLNIFLFYSLNNIRNNLSHYQLQFPSKPILFKY